MKLRFKLITTATLATALLGGCASMAGNSPAKVTDGMLVGPSGMPLYVFDRDTTGSGKSVCNGPCATNWPPLMAANTRKTIGD